MEFDRRQTIAALLASAIPLPARAAPLIDVAPYTAMAMQLTARSVAGAPDRAAVSAAILDHIAAIEPQIHGAAIFAAQFAGPPVKLVVLPEYLFTSYPARETVAEFASKIAVDPDGVEVDALCALAGRLGVHLAVNLYETDPHFPGLYFQASLILSPAGTVALRYRRLNSMFAPTPHDVWDRYLDLYGLDGVFPVARTEIGALACIASEEILYPEIARAHALRGAEVFCHSSSEIGGPNDTTKDIAKRARAAENLAYVVSANTAGIAHAGLPLASADGGSRVVDHKGQVLAQSGAGETFTAFAEIDLHALRHRRRTPAMSNTLARQRLELFAPVYAAASPQPANSLLDGARVVVPEREHFRRVQDATIERLTKDGLI